MEDDRYGLEKIIDANDYVIFDSCVLTDTNYQDGGLPRSYQENMPYIEYLTHLFKNNAKCGTVSDVLEEFKGGINKGFRMAYNKNRKINRGLRNSLIKEQRLIDTIYGCHRVFHLEDWEEKAKGILQNQFNHIKEEFELSDTDFSLLIESIVINLNRRNNIALLTNDTKLLKAARLIKKSFNLNRFNLYTGINKPYFYNANRSFRN